MEISAHDIIFEYQTDYNIIPDNEKAYFGGVGNGKGVIQQISSYIDGYKEASNAVFDRFKHAADQGHIWIQDTIVFPLIFCHRHCMELEIKRFFCLTDHKYSELANKTNHKLYELWSNVKPFIIERASRLDLVVDIDAFDHYIKEMDSYDEGSFRFRYPMDTKLISTNTNLELLNVVTFHRQMNLFHNEIGKIYSLLSDQVDEWPLNNDFKRQFIYCIKNNLDDIKEWLDYEYPRHDHIDKTWLRFSEIPSLSDAEIEKEYRYCNEIPIDIKELILILFYSRYTIKNNNISPNCNERLDDILKVCNDTYSNENIFGHNGNQNNIESIFLNKFCSIISVSNEIISLAEEIYKLSSK